MDDQENVVVRTYSGSQKRATAVFQEDVANMAASGYFPTTQSYAPGSYGSGAFLVAFFFVSYLSESLYS